MEEGKRFFDAKVLIGLAVICAGVLILLDNLGYGLHFSIWDWWPVLLILIGVTQVSKSHPFRQTGSGSVLIIIGLLLLFKNLDFITLRFKDIWPVLLILAGLGMLKHALWDPRNKAMDSEFINLSFILGGGEFKFDSKSMKGGKVAAIMGGGDIDLREADIKGNEMIIDIFAFWGGFDIKVPKNWQIHVQAFPLLGGIDNKTAGPLNKSEIAKERKTLVVKGMVVMGGVDIKN